MDVFACFIFKDQGFVKIPGYEPVELDLEKLFLLSVSKGDLDSRGKHEQITYNSENPTVQ